MAGRTITFQGRVRIIKRLRIITIYIIYLQLLVRQNWFQIMLTKSFGVLLTQLDIHQGQSDDAYL